MDILAALGEAAVDRGPRRCKIAAFLDSIPEDAPGRADLLNAVADAEAFPSRQLVRVFASLGAAIGRTTIQQHRAGAECGCSD